MAQDNSLSDKEIQKLLEIAGKQKEPKKEKEKPKEKQIPAFIEALSIEKGNNYIPAYIVYYTYFKWKYTNYYSRHKFMLEFRKYFQPIRRSNENGFMLNMNPFDMTVEGKFRARAFCRNEKEKNKKR